MTRGRYVRTPVIPQMEEQDCGAACLASVISGLGRRVTLHEVSNVCGVARDGLSAGDLVRGAAEFGLRASGRRVGKDQLAATPMPAIAVLRQGHFVVLEGVRRGWALINDPTLGRLRKSVEDFDRDFTGVAITFERTAEFTVGGPRFRFARDLVRRAWPYRAALAVAMVAALMTAVPGALATLLLRGALRAQAPGAPDDVMPRLALVAGVAAAVMFGASWLQQRVLARALQAMSARGSAQFLWRMLRLPGEFFHRRSLGGLVTRVQVNDGLAVLLTGRVVAAMTAVLSACLYLGAIAIVDARFVPVAATAGVIDVAVLVIIARRRLGRLHVLQTIEARRDAVAFSAVASIETLKAEGSEEVFFTRWAGHQATALRVGQQIVTSGLVPLTVAMVLSTFTSGVTAVLGAHLLLDGTLDFASLLALLVLMGGFLAPMGSLVGIGTELLVARAQCAMLEDVEATPIRPDRIVTHQGVDVDDEPRLSGALQLRSVSVGYDPNRAPQLQDVDLSVRPGEWVAVIGPSGAGKSTLGRLAAGSLNPWSGAVELDGVPRDDLPHAVTVRDVAYVSQRINLFAGTVRDNLTLWGGASADDTQLWRALADAQLADVVRRRGGLDAAVAEQARNFSGGERQRLEIARALVRDPVLLVLDEATSALDAATEERVNRRLRGRRCSCLLLAHRASTVRGADRVVGLEAGRLVEVSARVGHACPADLGPNGPNDHLMLETTS